jgi:hypothetical protein
MNYRGICLEKTAEIEAMRENRIVSFWFFCKTADCNSSFVGGGNQAYDPPIFHFCCSTYNT